LTEKYSSFSRKRSKKREFCFTGCLYPRLCEWRFEGVPQLTYWPKSILLFPEKEAKSESSVSQKTVLYPSFREADPGGLKACPQLTYWSKSILLFPEKEAKSESSVSQKTVSYPRFREADPGGLGACPQLTYLSKSILLFPEKEGKSESWASWKNGGSGP
jgi:hypothetical protein